MRFTVLAILAIGIIAILFVSPVLATDSSYGGNAANENPAPACFISATSDSSQVLWGDTITFTGSAECSRAVTFRLMRGPGIPAGGILLGTVTPSDGTYEFGWDTGSTKQQHSLADGEYTVFITSEPDGQYTKIGVLISSDTGSTPEENTQPSSTCFISATADNNQVFWGDTISFRGSAEGGCTQEITFRLKDEPGVPSGGILLGTTTPDSDRTYEYDWDTGSTQQEYSLKDGQYTVYLTSEPNGQYTRIAVLLSSDTVSTPEETEMSSPDETGTTETTPPAITEIKTARTTYPTLAKTETVKQLSPATAGITQTSTTNPSIVPAQTIQVTTTPPAAPNDVVSVVVNFFKGLFGLK